MLAHCYQSGAGVKRNYAEALQWVRKAAARGSEKARLGLGLAYRDGKWVERDYAQAYHWLDLAALQGNTNAIAARDDLFRRMTPEQRASAGAVARLRLAKYDSAFAQSAGSCVMSSYAIAANHFTGLPVTAFFEGYCHHFGIAYTNALDAKLGLPASFYIHHSTFFIPP
jgi:TPR repeat protein